VEWVQLTTSDGHVLDADLSQVPDARAGVVLCHPHPQYGGSRFDHVVSALFDGLPDHAISVLRFDFRRAYGGGIDERIDAAAAIDVLAGRLDGRPVHLVGYSFGAMVALGTAHAGVASRVLIAPPFPMDPALASDGPLAGPTLVIVPEHDQFCPPEAARAVVDTWGDAALATVSMADHFLVGRASVVVDLVGEWVTGRRPSSDP